MKFDPNCVRDILLYIEKNVPYGSHVKAREIMNDLADVYDEDETEYYIGMLIDNNYLYTNSRADLRTRVTQIKGFTEEGFKLVGSLKSKKVIDKLNNMTIISIADLTAKALSIFASISQLQ